MNAPKTLTEAESIQNSQNQTDGISRFADAILQVELPIEEPHRCCQRETVPSGKVEVPARARILGALEPFMLFCECCGKEYPPTFMNRRVVQRSSDILQSAISTELEKTDITPDRRNNSSDDYIRGVLLNSTPLDPCAREDSGLAYHAYRNLLLRLANSVQIHNTSHHSTCSKNSQRTGMKNQYQFVMPRDVTAATEMERNGSHIKSKRYSSSIYLNAFNEAMLLGFKSNHDLQLLFGTGRCIALHCVVRYITKSQNRIHQLPLISLDRSMERRIAPEAADQVPRDSRVRVRRRLS